MSKTFLIIVGTVFLTTATIITALATISGAIGAVQWASSILGPVPVSMIGAFVAGATITHAVDRGLAARRRLSAPDRREIASSSGHDRMATGGDCLVPPDA